MIFRHKPLWIAAACIACLIFFFGTLRLMKKRDAVHIAVVCPLSGAQAPGGTSILNGAALYVERLNEAGGVDGKQIIIDAYDDKGDPNAARQKAADIVKQGRALAVIGHYDSPCAQAAGAVYKKHNIPVITPTAVSPDVTANNPWQFRNVNNSVLQGRFTAYYLKEIIGAKAVSVIYEDHPYGAGIAKALARTCADLNMDIKLLLNFPADETFQDAVIADIVNAELSAAEDPGVIFLATRANAGVKLVRRIRDAGVRAPLGGPDAFSSDAFRTGFDASVKEKIYPGYYTNEVFVVSSILFDSGNAFANRFREAYLEKYGAHPESTAALAHDAAKVIAEAIRHADVRGEPDAIAPDRRKIRDYLAGLNGIETAVEGTTGYNYFDENGDAEKEIHVGIYKSNILISTFNQLRKIRYLNEIFNIEKAIARGDVFRIDGKYMYKNKIVKTGVKVNDIRDVDVFSLTCVMDCNVWFRYQGDLDVERIIIENAAEPMSLKNPIAETVTPFDAYRMYNLKGKFKIDFFRDRYAFGRHVLGLRFHHPDLTRNKLIFVSDIVGMGLTKGVSPVQKMKQDNVFGYNEGWSVVNVRFFSDTFRDDPQGRPQYLNLLSGIVEHSAFNAWIKVKTDAFTLRGLMPFQASAYLLIACVLALGGVAYAARRKADEKFGKRLWFLKSVLAVTLLLAAEVFLIRLLIDRINLYQLTMLTRAFDSLWWITAAFLLCNALEHFLWTPLEKRTGRQIPMFLRRFIAIIIYLLAFLAVVAFVFGQKVTSLLATSGVFAMIIGLAIQMNISNIFSGIAINVETPFRINDWVAIGNYDEGIVVDITWRTTRIRSRTGNIISIPNSVASEAVTVNYNYPDKKYRRPFTIHVDPAHAPERISRIVHDALISCDAVEKSPAPHVRFKGYSEWSADYAVIFTLNDYGKLVPQQDAVKRTVWRRLREAGVEPVIRHRDIRLSGADNARAIRRTGDENEQGPAGA